jgi:DNA polymerase I-like protein with 3'-5' exonuclease and polymerase domains
VERSIVDFETEKIESRPKYPPVPVGAAIELPGREPEYLAWGHPQGNNCDIPTARTKLREAFSYRTVFHNANFDMDIAECYFGLKPASFDDTMFLAFLNDPHERDLKLKPLGERLLGMKPEERDDLREWIQTNIPEARRGKTKWAEYIGQAPGGLVGDYAVGDVRRTDRLFHKLRPMVADRGMSAAYRRELAVAPIVIGMERTGVRVDRARLKHALSVFEKLDRQLILRIQQRLGVSNGRTLSETFNVDSGKQLGAALLRAGKLDAVVRTPKGQQSTKIDVLRKTCTDKKLLDLLAVHSVCHKYVTSFIRPWLAQSEVTDGRILPRFNQVPNDGGGGARSGRFSSSDPNLQNVPADVEESQNKDTLLLLQQWLKAEFGYNFLGLRDFILPDEGMLMICVDYSQQELRFLAHFERGLLCEAYNKDPTMDVHEFVRQLINKEVGLLFERKHVKRTVFGIIYGMGVGKLAALLGIDVKTAKKLRDGVLRVLPGISRLMKHLKRLAEREEPLITWGGRQYYCEPPRRMYDHEKKCWRTVDFTYKMLNYEIQPSAADCTKQGMIQVHEDVGDRCRIAVQVHDELMVMAPSAKYGRRIAEAMCDVKLRVPMLADVKISEESWARAKKLA